MTLHEALQQLQRIYDARPELGYCKLVFESLDLPDFRLGIEDITLDARDVDAPPVIVLRDFVY